MLHLDYLDPAKVKAIRSLIKREDFGVNEVDIQPNGAIFLNGYFSLRELQLLTQISEKLNAEKSPSLH